MCVILLVFTSFHEFKICVAFCVLRLSVFLRVLTPYLHYFCTLCRTPPAYFRCTVTCFSPMVSFGPSSTPLSQHGATRAHLPGAVLDRTVSRQPPPEVVPSEQVNMAPVSLGHMLREGSTVIGRSDSMVQAQSLEHTVGEGEQGASLELPVGDTPQQKNVGESDPSNYCSALQAVGPDGRIGRFGDWACPPNDHDLKWSVLLLEELLAWEPCLPFLCEHNKEDAWKEFTKALL